MFIYIYILESNTAFSNTSITLCKILHISRVLDHNMYGMFVIYFLIFTGGLIAYASYAGCDPMALGIIKRKEEIMTHFISDKLTFIPGLPGIFVATIIGGTLR